MISIAVTTHNEGDYVADLCSRLTRFIEQQPDESYQLVIVDDYSDDTTTRETLDSVRHLPYATVTTHALNGDFAAHKNFLLDNCMGEWVLNVDADEWMSDSLLAAIPDIITENPTVDAYWFPRVNTVLGITPTHLAQWGWTLMELDGVDEPVIQWPDPQLRLFRNAPHIRWVGKVHERITGHAVEAMLPLDPAYAIHHRKTIERQEQQNALYRAMT